MGIWGSSVSGGAVNVEDIAYNETTWNGDTDAASKNVIRDKLVLVDAHASSDGSSHTYINQNVSTTAAPTFAGAVFNGSVGIHTTTPDGILDCTPDTIDTGSFAYPFPRLTTTQRTALTGVSDGACCYDITIHALFIYENSAWVQH